MPSATRKEKKKEKRQPVRPPRLPSVFGGWKLIVAFDIARENSGAVARPAAFLLLVRSP